MLVPHEDEAGALGVVLGLLVPQDGVGADGLEVPQEEELRELDEDEERLPPELLLVLA